MLVKRTKSFALAVTNLARAAGYGKGANMNTGQKVAQGALGTGKLVGLAALGTAAYGTAKFAGASKDALTGKMGDKEDE